MRMKESMLELITAQQHLSSHVCYAVITSIAFGFIVLAKRHGVMKQGGSSVSWNMDGITLQLCVQNNSDSFHPSLLPSGRLQIHYDIKMAHIYPSALHCFDMHCTDQRQLVFTRRLAAKRLFLRRYGIDQTE